MGKFVSSVDEFFKFCDEHEVAFVDFRFTDLKGTWHHMSYNYKRLDKDFANGIPFDGSSVDAWQPIDKSDMMLKPDVDTTFLDPFTADVTAVVICDVYDIYKNELYEKCPRSIAKKAEAFLKTTAEGNFEGYKVVLDTANGAAYTSARAVFADLEANLTVIGENPDGLNINVKVGSTHPEAMAKKVVETGSDLGLAFDGDADRLIAVDENGEIVDGDKIMFIVGKYLLEQGKLAQDTLVTTVMSNLGFHLALEEAGINSVITAVGDRYVVEEMKKNNYNFGGEQSGHMIFLDYNTTGDGQLSAIQLLKVMRETGKTLSELASEVTIYPQKLVNVRVKDNAAKKSAMDVPAIQKVISEMETSMNGKGRILVRPSGTEPLLRVMAEAPTHEQVEHVVDTIVEVVEAEIGVK